MTEHLKAITKKRIKELNLALVKKEISKTNQKQITQIAQELLNNTFSFNKRWDMERCMKKYQLTNFSFYNNPTADEEWLYMLNRFDWISYLTLATSLTDNATYANKAKEFIFTWIKQHPQLEPDVTTRTLDTGIRIVNILNALPYLEAAHLLSDQDYETISQSLLSQIQYLKASYIPRYKTSNWGSIQTMAILIAIPWLVADYEHNYIFTWAKRELAFQLKVQILDDGFHWEQSFMYHVEVLNYLQYLLYFQRYFGFNLEYDIAKPITKMTNALAFALTSKKELELFGDSDVVATRDVFNRTSLLLNNAKFKFLANKKLDYETMYIVGFGKNNSFQTLTAQPIAQKSFYGQDAGIITIRNSWKDDATRLFFTNGSLGSGHGHADNLHLSVDINGKACLIDSGRYSYQEQEPLRVQLKSMQAHNVIVLDNNPCSIPQGSWDYQKFAKPFKPYFKEHDNYHYLEASLLTPNPLSIWTRKVLMLDEGSFIIFDELNANGHHNYKQYFHLPNYSNINIKDNKVAILNNYLLLSNKASETCLTETQVSPSYNSLAKAYLVTVKGEFSDSENLTTILSSNSIKIFTIPIMQGSKQLPKHVAEGFEIKTKNTTYLFALLHSEIFTGSKILKIKDYYFHAQALLIKVTDKSAKYYYLKS